MSHAHFKESQECWNAIAKSFDATRNKPWQFVADFISLFPSDSIIADIGCGNGRHLLSCIEKFKICIGLDISANLLDITKDKINNRSNVSLMQGNLVYLPFKDESIDVILYIAALHNIKQRSYRILSLKEVNRVLNNHGKAVISVWSVEQERFRDKLKKNKNFLSENGDINVVWKKDNLNISRFYHLYSMQEFKEDILSAGLQIISVDELMISSKKHPDNYIAVVGKG